MTYPTPDFLEGMPQRRMFRGDSFVFDVQVKQQPPRALPDTPAAPVDITGYRVWFTAKNNFGDPDLAAVVQLDTVGGGVVITDAPAGRAEVTVEPVKTAGFPDAPQLLVYDVQVQDLSGRIFTVEVGTLLVIPDVTRALA